MKQRQQEDGTATELMDLWRSPDTGDPGWIVGQQLGGEVAQRADHLRPDQPDLLEQVGQAGLDLQRLGVAVAGPQALQDVGDEDVVP